ncbi:27705_t:CDS:2, partial [Gigaspora margarita]
EVPSDRFSAINEPSEELLSHPPNLYPSGSSYEHPRKYPRPLTFPVYRIRVLNSEIEETSIKSDRGEPLPFLRFQELNAVILIQEKTPNCEEKC